MNPGATPASKSLLVGVTGHRDLRPEEVPAIEEAVRGLLRRVDVVSEHSLRCVVSPLAEGADQLVARVAIDEGWGLIALLPLPLPIYREDFVTPDARQRFDDLLSRAAESLVMPPTAGGAWDTLPRGDLDRPSHYAAAGSWLARHVDLLIAVWDGNAIGKTGGTADVVAMRLANRPNHGHESTRPGGSSLAHILSGRVSTQPATNPGVLCLLPGEPTGSACDAPGDDIRAWIDSFTAGGEPIRHSRGE